LINFIPLALAAIAPVGMGLVILLLTSQKGIGKALAYLIAQALAFAIWGIVFLNLSLKFEGLGPHEPGRASLALRTFLGILLLVIAVRIYFADQDPDALPLKWQALIDRISAIALFFLNLVMSLFQLRFVLLIMIGTDMISSAHFSQTGNLLALLILLFVLLWPQLLPLAAVLGLGGNKDRALKVLNDWLARNARLVNAGLLGVLGFVLLWSGLSGLAAL
jgi:hypothetical protein